MRQPAPARSLHFRITAAFVLLLAVGGGGYYLWLERTLYAPYDDAEEKHWYEELAAAELDSLAAVLAPLAAEPGRAGPLLQDYGRGVARYEAELIVFDAAGRHAASSAADSLAAAVPFADPALLRDMSSADWDFGSYPRAEDVSAYENRVFAVRPLVPAGGDEAAPAGYLVASFMPPTIAVGELEADARRMGLHAALLLLLYAAASSTIIMLWTTRRLRRLSRGVAAFAAGDLGARVPASSADEIGSLGRHINTMAQRIAGMVDELTRKESFQRQLVANVSHDLRTPLASLRGYVETLSLGGAQVGEQERGRYLAVVTEKLDHLDRLIEHVLILSRMDSGQAGFRPEDFSLGELAGTVLDRCAQPAADRAVSLDLDLDPDLPDVHADPLQIGRVLQNLVENGVKFTPAGGRVAVRARRVGAKVEVEVADTGVGIDPRDLPHIFERFYTGDKSRTVADAGPADHLSRSSGLGLAIAARIVEVHGARLEVQSAPGAGSVF
ncbi:MAG: HAMP domain-containing protein, partial [Krumholzibacteria bacterium]|nr:HAMP domain-containing protein [Candidatus Krumholzibacteria bacterium]